MALLPRASRSLRSVCGTLSVVRHESSNKKIEKLKRKYKVKPEVEEFVRRRQELWKRSGIRDLTDVGGMRELMEQYTRDINDNTPLDGETWDDTIQLDGVPGGVPITVYRGADLPENPAIFVYFHGGGMVIGSRKTSESTCISICNYAKCIVINVEYRLAPDVRKATILKDAQEIAKTVLQTRAVYGSNSSSVGIGGDSSGGYIAAYTARSVPDLDFQVLIYPNVDTIPCLPSWDEFADDLILPRVALSWYHNLQSERGDFDSPSASSPSYFWHSFVGLPPALIICAQIDPLRDGSAEYQEDLSRAGVPVEYYMYEGIVHGFFSYPGIFKDDCDRACKRIAEFIRKYHKTSPA